MAAGVLAGFALLGWAFKELAEAGDSLISREALDQMFRMLVDRLREPVRLEVRLLDDRVIARRLDGNRAVSVDLSRGYRMVGYISV